MGQIPGLSTSAEFVSYDSFYEYSPSDSHYVIYRSVAPVASYFAEQKNLGLEGQIVYIDSNQNSQRDSDEIFTTTDAEGNYSFNVAPGAYTIAEDPQFGYLQVAPNNQSYHVSLDAGEKVSFVDFVDTLQGVHQGIDNSSPVFTSQPKTDIVAGQKLLYQATATDRDGDPLRYDLVVKPDGMLVDPVTGLVSWRPTTAQVGDHTAILRVQDGYGGVTLQSFQVKVEPSVPPPVFISEPPSNTIHPIVGHAFQYQFNAQDTQGNPVTFQLDSPDSNAAIDASTGLFTWTPTTSTYSGSPTGAFPFAVTAVNGQGGKTTILFQLKALDTTTEPNAPPSITSSPSTRTAVGQTYLYQVEASDSNHDALAYSLVNAPNGMTIDKTGRILWMAKADQLGTQSVTVQVNDGQGGITTQNYQLQVTNSSDLVIHPRRLQVIRPIPIWLWITSIGIRLRSVILIMSLFGSSLIKHRLAWWLIPQAAQLCGHQPEIRLALKKLLCGFKEGVATTLKSLPSTLNRLTQRWRLSQCLLPRLSWVSFTLIKFKRLVEIRILSAMALSMAIPTA